MENKSSKSKLLTLRNSGILGQEMLHVKNGEYIWSLHNKGYELLGRYSLDKGQSWTEWQVLLSDYSGHFSFTTGQEDELHISCKNIAGNLVYVYWDGDQVLVDELGDKWLDKERVFYQTVLVYGDKVSMIYFTDSPVEDIWRIKYCIKDEGGWNIPEVVDYGTGQGQNQGAAAIDDKGIIHLIYQTYEKSKYQFVYREKQLNGEDWGEGISITDSNRSNLYPCLVLDKKGTLHLTWMRSDGMNYRVLYRRKTRGGWMVGGWQPERYISEEGVNAYNPTIGVLDDNVIIIWQQTAGIFQSSSFDEGKTFNEPVLKKQYQKLTYNNMLSLDAYKRRGLSTTATFDTGSTSIALLATVFQNGLEEDESIESRLPNVKQEDGFVLPNMRYLSIDYGQKDLEKHLKNVNGNVHRLIFETEDVRVTNLQMKDTIEENINIIGNLEEGIKEKNQEINKLLEKQRTLENLVVAHQETIKEKTSKEKVSERKKAKLEAKIQEFKNEKKELEVSIKKIQQKLDEKSKRLNQLEDEMNEKDASIFKLENENQDLRKKIKELENRPLWRKLVDR
ncbi:hypothetical protein GGQ84_001324 [Desulfitispora alkaliphila]|uniref:hypothetical protein n=1 Tax=Desulfitispora alkaliphila TaxID=622674 RepID=UPI003D1F7F83